MDRLKHQYFQAAHQGLYRQLEQCLQQGISANIEENDSRDTALLIACRKGYPHLIALCLSYGGKNDPHPHYGQTALHAAVDADQYEAAKALLEAAARVHADASIINLCDSTGRTPLHVAASKNDPKMIDLLIRHGADMSSLDNSGRTPLHLAVLHGSSPIVSALLVQDGSLLLEVPDAKGNTALHIAVERDDVKCATVLLESGAASDTRNATGKTALEIAQRSRNTKMIYLLRKYNKTHVHDRTEDRSNYDDTESADADDSYDDFYSPDSFNAIAKDKKVLASLQTPRNAHGQPVSLSQLSYAVSNSFYNEVGGGQDQPDNVASTARSDYEYTNPLPQQGQGEQLVYNAGTQESWAEPVSVSTEPQQPSEQFELYNHTWLVYTTGEGYAYYWSEGLGHSQWDDPRVYDIINPTQELAAYVEECRNYNPETENSATHHNYDDSKGESAVKSPKQYTGELNFDNLQDLDSSDDDDIPDRPVRVSKSPPRSPPKSPYKPSSSAYALFRTSPTTTTAHEEKHDSTDQYASTHSTSDSKADDTNLWTSEQHPSSTRPPKVTPRASHIDGFASLHDDGAGGDGGSRHVISLPLEYDSHSARGSGDRSRGAKPDL